MAILPDRKGLPFLFPRAVARTEIARLLNGRTAYSERVVGLRRRGAAHLRKTSSEWMLRELAARDGSLSPSKRATESAYRPPRSRHL